LERNPAFFMIFGEKSGLVAEIQAASQPKVRRNGFDGNSIPSCSYAIMEQKHRTGKRKTLMLELNKN
jgi:hypothetical protein